MITSRSVLVLLTFLAIAFAIPRSAKNVEPVETLGQSKFFIPTPRNVSLGESNMPTSWQVQAAQIAQEVYELQSTDSARLQMFSELFSEAHPYWYWNIALNYRYVHHNLAYYVEVAINQDQLYIFSTT